jgi:hypothetical protein
LRYCDIEKKTIWKGQGWQQEGNIPPAADVMLIRLFFATTFSTFSGFRHTQRLQDHAQRAEFTEPELKEVQADKKGQEEKILMNKDRIAAAVKA